MILAGTPPDYFHFKAMLKHNQDMFSDLTTG